MVKVLFSEVLLLHKMGKQNTQSGRRLHSLALYYLRGLQGPTDLTHTQQHLQVCLI